MKILVRISALILVVTFLFVGCKTQNDASVTDVPKSSLAGDENELAIQSITEIDFSNMFTDRDNRIEYGDNAVNISLNGDSVSSDSNAVSILGTTIKITEEATYVFTGTLNDGMILVDAPDTAKIQLVFHGVSITSSTSAPLYILEADKVFVTLIDGTNNTLSNGGEFIAMDENNIDAAVFSKQDLTFNGSGMLTVTSPSAHGIVCKDDLVFTGGTYSVHAASHALDANDSIRITGSSITIDAGKDGIHAENTDDASLGFIYIVDGSFSIEAEGDGISASSYLNILDGEFQILAGGGSENGTKSSSLSYGNFMGGGRNDRGNRKDEKQMNPTQDETIAVSDESTSMKGIKSSGNMQITGGVFEIDSADDAFHSNASIDISGGSYEIASGDDGIHADESLNVSGGTIDISKSYEGLEALHLNISDGKITLIATDDGFNAAGGTDDSGTLGRDMKFRGMGGGRPSGNGSILISGGNININASGDGIDANGTLEITGGYIIVCGPTQGDTSILDFDKSGVISGGTFIGTGAFRMAQSFSMSENQGVISTQVNSVSTGTKIKLTDAKDNEIITYVPELGFDMVIISSPSIRKGETYMVTIGSNSQELQAN